MRPNIRRCPDGFEVTCRSGEIVRGAVVIDAHDREIVSRRAVANAGIGGSDIRDMMPGAVERRFGTCRANRPVEMPSDNGSPCIARETRIPARQFGPAPCVTPVRSPRSNDMPEAFAKPPRRDHVHVTPLPDAATVREAIARRLEDDEDDHPHSGPKMRSPRELIPARTATARVPGETGAGSYRG
jgi:transposase InsO family protein